MTIKFHAISPRRSLLTRRWASWPARDTAEVAAGFSDKPIDIGALSKAELRAYCEAIADEEAPKIYARLNRRSPLLDLVSVPDCSVAPCAADMPPGIQKP